VEFVEGRIQVACLNALVIEEDALVEGLVEIPADRIGAVGVGRLRVRHEIEGAEKHLGPYCQYRTRAGQAGFSGDSLGLNLAQLRLDLCMRKLIVGEQVEESILLGLQLFELAADGCVQFGDAALLAGQRIFEELADIANERSRQVQRGVVVDDRLLHLVCG
jgi:hypothetical protein